MGFSTFTTGRPSARKGNRAGLARTKQHELILVAAAVLCLLFAAGCKDTVVLMPQGEDGIPPSQVPGGDETGGGAITISAPETWHEETCTCGGTLTLEELGEGEVAVTCTETHSAPPDGTAGNAFWKAELGYKVNTPGEGPYLVSFEAKADSAYESCLSVYNSAQKISLADNVPIAYTTEYKKYNFVFFINANVLEGNGLSFRVNKGTTYVKNMTIENLWHTDYNKEKPWKVWQDASCTELGEGETGAGHISIYEMTKDSVKAVSRTAAMKSPADWKHQLEFRLADTSAGKYLVSFTDNSCTVSDSGTDTMGNIYVQYYDDAAQANVVISCAKRADGHGKYYFYFDIPEEEDGKPFGIFFHLRNKSLQWAEEHFILEDVKVEKVTEESELDEGYTRLEKGRDYRVIAIGDSGWEAGGWITEDTLGYSNAGDKGITVTLNKDAADSITLLSPMQVTIEPGQAVLFTCEIVQSKAELFAVLDIRDTDFFEGMHIEHFKSQGRFETLVANNSDAAVTVSPTVWWSAGSEDSHYADDWLTISNLSFTVVEDYSPIINNMTVLAGGGESWPATFTQVEAPNGYVGTVEYTYTAFTVDGEEVYSGWGDEEGKLSFKVLPKDHDWDNGWSKGEVPVGAGYVAMTPRAGGEDPGIATFTGLESGATYVISVLSAWDGSVYVKIDKK